MTCDVTKWIQSGVQSQKIEYLSRLFLYRTETLYSCYTHHKAAWYVHCDISMATQSAPDPLHSKGKIRVFLLQEVICYCCSFSGCERECKKCNTIAKSVIQCKLHVQILDYDWLMNNRVSPGPIKSFAFKSSVRSAWRNWWRNFSSIAWYACVSSA